MTNDQFNRLQTARAQLTQARKAFTQAPNPGLSSVIRRLSRHIRTLQTATYHVECTDTYGGEANYCWVRRFSVRASSLSGAARVAARHLGYSGRIVSDGAWDDGGRWNVRGAAICFFVSWPSEFDRSDYPLVNGRKG